MLGELVCVAHEIEQRLADSGLVGMHLADILRTVDDDFVAVLRRHGADRGDYVVDQRRDGEGLDVHVHPAGFDLRQVQNVVDEFQQMVRRTQYALQRFELFCALQVARVLMQHLRQADDRIQWRAQLVRHIRQELRFQLAGLRQLLTLRLAFLEQPGILDGQYRLRGQRLQQFHDRGREFARHFAADHQCAGHVLVAQQRYRNHGADSVVHPQGAYPLG